MRLAPRSDLRASTTRCSTGGTRTTPIASVRRRVLRPQLAQLVERFRPELLWGDGHWGHNGAWWRADRIVEDYYAAMQAVGPDGCVNDRFSASHADYAVYEYDVRGGPERRVGAVPGLVVLLLLQPGRARRRPPERGRARRDAHRSRGEGGNLLLNVGRKRTAPSRRSRPACCGKPARG